MADATLGVDRSASTHIQMAGNFTFMAGCVLSVTFGLCGVTLRMLAIEIAFLQRVGFVPISQTPEDGAPSNRVSHLEGHSEPSGSCH
jgi:hypothetical protein